MTSPLTRSDLDALVQVATTSVEHAVRHRDWHPDPEQYPPRLREPGAAFVTLRCHDRLRGCIGTLTADEPLVTCVADRARAAAQRDPRFDPVGPDEVADLTVEVSVLNHPDPMAVSDYDELLRTVRPGVDGVVVEAGSQRATLLPAVWDDLPDPDEFLAALWRKAGLRPREWPHRIRVSRFAAQHWPP